MKILIAGGLGFVGTALTQYFLKTGHQVVATGTRPRQSQIFDDRFLYIPADTTRPGAWQEALRDMDAVVNLAGRPIFQKWDAAYKQSIYDSRILTTRNLVEGLSANSGKPTLISTSAVGYYGDRKDDLLTESDPPGSGFLARVCRDWEAEALRAEKNGARVVTTRFGVVLADDGGALTKMIQVFRFYAGGPAGSGRQWFSWIHRHDLIRAMAFVLEHSDIRGPVNFCSPEPTRNGDFAKILGRVLGKPAFLRTPGIMLRLVLGEFGSTLLQSQRVTPRVLMNAGFDFQFPNALAALSNLVRT